MTADLAIDAGTAEVIRSAVTAAQAGRLGEACAIGERGLTDGYDPVPLHAMVGSFLCAMNEFARAIPHLERAFEGRRTDGRIAANLATALVGVNRYSDALQVLTEDVAAQDRTGRMQRLRGFAGQMSGEFALGVKAYEHAIELQPDDWEIWNNLGNCRISAGDLGGGIEALRRAASLNRRDVPPRLNLARVLRDTGAFAEAESLLRSLADDFPGDHDVLADLVGMLRSQGRESDAKDVLEQAARKRPHDVKVLVSLGQQYLVSIAYDDAERMFRRALAIDPSNGDAFTSLAEILEHTRPEQLATLLDEMRLAGVDQAPMNYVGAMIARRERRYRDGLDALKGIASDFDPASRCQLEGQLLEGLGDYAAAFRAFVEMNRAHFSDPSEPLVRAATMRKQLRGELERMTQSWRDSWTVPPLASALPSPAFLVGFPRSGTTLLDTFLMGHPDVEVMEERPVLGRLRHEGADFESIAEMDEEKVRRLQNRYFEIAREHAELRPGTLLVDKSPLHMQHVPQICRLFPDARFILALRHPADVVLSCYISNFRLNSAMSSFLQLETAAEFYDLTFSMWEKALEIFHAEVHTIVYENMIQTPELALKPLVDGLGLSWNPGMLDHQQTAAKRGVITTASYAQVTQPLYRTSAGRWRNYREHLEPILPTLRPWIEKFGYDM